MAYGFMNIARTPSVQAYRGNRQYISTGNFKASDRACMVLVDYPRRARLKRIAQLERENASLRGKLNPDSL